MDLIKLQKLLVVKLSEKFALNVRGLKQAFALYDKDGNGLLDLNELQKGLAMILNGVKDNELTALVQAYDLNGDGMLSYEEFLAVLQNPKVLLGNAPSAAYSPPVPPVANNHNPDVLTTFRKKGENKYADEDYDMFGNHVETARKADISRFPVRPPAPELNAVGRGGSRQGNTRRSSSQESSIFSFNDADDVSVIESHIDLSSSTDLEGRARAFLNSLKAYLHEEALKLRQTGKAGNLRERLSLSSTTLLNGIARDLLAKAFQP